MDREAGFTLMETLVALALVGMVSLLLFEGMRFTSTAWQGREARADGLAGAIAAGDGLRAALTAASDPRILQDFSGDASRLTLITGFAPAPEQSAAARHVEIWADGGALRSRSRNLEADTWQREVVIARGVTAVAFRYHGGARGWIAEWDLPDRLPQLVEMRIETETLRHWPAIVVAPGTGPVRH